LDPSAIGMSGPRQEANWPVATLIALIPAGAVAAVSMFSWQPIKIRRFAGHAKSTQLAQWTVPADGSSNRNRLTQSHDRIMIKLIREA